jgi:exonuclease III
MISLSDLIPPGTTALGYEPRNTPPPSPRKFTPLRPEPPTESNSLKIFSQNIQKKDPVPFVKAAFSEGYLIVALQEVNTTHSELTDQLRSFYPGALVVAHTNGSSKGSCIVVHPHLVPYSSEFPHPSDQFQLATVRISLPTLPPFLVSSCYSSMLLDEQKALLPLLKGLLGHEVVLVGDLNCTFCSLDHVGMATPPRNEEFARWLLDGKLIDLFRHQHPLTSSFSRYSLPHRPSASRLDYTLITPRLLTSLTAPLSSIHTHNFTSDHHPVS